MRRCTQENRTSVALTPLTVFAPPKLGEESVLSLVERRFHFITVHSMIIPRLICDQLQARIQLCWIVREANQLTFAFGVTLVVALGASEEYPTMLRIGETKAQANSFLGVVAIEVARNAPLALALGGRAVRLLQAAAAA